MRGVELLCVAEPEQAYRPYDANGAIEQARRAKLMNRHVASVKKNVDRLDLVAEAARHNEHLADAPIIPFGDRVDAVKRLEDKELTQSKAKKPLVLSQFGEDARVEDCDYLEEGV